MIEKVFKIVKIDEQVKDTAYWRSRPAEERLAMVEQLRREYWGEDYDKEGIAKVVRIVKKSETDDC